MLVNLPAKVLKLEGLRLPPGLDPFDARSIPIHLPTVIAA
jgi:hypothetical protein